FRKFSLECSHLRTLCHPTGKDWATCCFDLTLIQPGTHHRNERLPDRSLTHKCHFLVVPSCAPPRPAKAPPASCPDPDTSHAGEPTPPETRPGGESPAVDEPCSDQHKAVTHHRAWAPRTLLMACAG